ncbi:efflux RND transporter periplasmic adaptor subunit [Pseudoalteromonas luteoviolacea]|uniref:RND efflux pump membrane fusion protein barrel-sandwich domain-containing protein n=1 Tax=Pseudoalteromonas luteoviolacea (strain 2ta16) TaxID=1353533 RepID=V4HKQ4_PSEL2|nr:HlyD family efflux transporter periplasmic adaptor subunit [Pseudoalteromonas luteoviolacea]ESP91395.1 hypothetical protein PL2TA16_00194 [Pseudoalteromonas luteoviolacea 2ta16]KZN40041.1 hypothetical protein N483_17800 [Pseudoalteromonas luteoviolacea NCIMB 1944]
MKLKHALLCAFFLQAGHVMASPGAHGPNGEHLDQKANRAEGGLGRQSDGSVIMPMKHQALLNIRTHFATESMAAKHVRLDAIVKPHPAGYAKIQSSRDGRLDAPEAGVLPSGSKVVAGDVLGLIRYQDTDYELASQTSELIAIRNRIEQTKRDVSRLKKLGELASKQALEQLETELLSLKQQAQALQKGLEKPEVLISPVSGVLINHAVSRGQWVEAGQTLFEVISPEQLIVEASTNDSHLPAKLTTAKAITQPSLNFNYIGHTPLRVNGLIHVNFELEKTIEAPALLVNQRITIQAPINEQQRGIVLPADAIVRSQNNLPQVWIKLSAERFLPQLVKYENLQPGFVLVTQGLGADNRVVVTGASLLNQVR